MTDQTPQPTGLAGLFAEVKDVEHKLADLIAPAPAAAPAATTVSAPSPENVQPAVTPAMVISDEPIPVPADAVPVPTPAPSAPIVSPQLNDAATQEAARIASLEADKQAFYERIRAARAAGLPPEPKPQPVPERIRLQTEAEKAAGAAAVAAHAEQQGKRIIPVPNPKLEGVMKPVFTPAAFNEYHDTFKSPVQTISKDAIAQPRQPG